MFLANDLPSVLKRSRYLFRLYPHDLALLFYPDPRILTFPVSETTRPFSWMRRILAPTLTSGPSVISRPPVPIITTPISLLISVILGVRFLIFIFSVCFPCGIGVSSFPLYLVVRSFVLSVSVSILTFSLTPNFRISPLGTKTAVN